MTILLGHEALEQHFIQLYHNNTLPHAVILYGAEGIGKRSFAYQLATFVLDSSAQLEPNHLCITPNSQTQKWFHQKTHPHVLFIEREYDSVKNKKAIDLKLDDVRRIHPFLQMTAQKHSYRVIIIEDAHHLNRNASNYLLKILEEPPQKTLFILTCNHLQALLPTIRSRAAKYYMKPLQEPYVKTLIQQFWPQKFSDSETQALIRLSKGRFGKLHYLVTHELVESHFISERFMQNIETKTASECLQFAESLSGRSEEELFLWVDYYTQILYQNIKIKAQDYFSTTHYYKLFETQITQLRDMFYRYLDKKTCIFLALNTLKRL